ncbi:mitochondrial carrier domain-containing protein [Phlyctochytrium arcticum]|nr:mitochondrial carrier domain-containing protein [Phlyctochytrium arcticum]
MDTSHRPLTTSLQAIRAGAAGSRMGSTTAVSSPASPAVRQLVKWIEGVRGKWEGFTIPKFQRGSPLADLVFGSAAGLTSKIVEHPFDTIKVRLQTQPMGEGRMYTNSIDCLRKTVAAEGPSGLLRGIAPPLVASMLEHAVLFSFYVAFKPVVHSLLSGQPLDTRYPHTNHSHATPPSSSIPAAPIPHSTPFVYSYTDITISGALAGVFASFVLTPLELIKCKQQVAESSTKGGARSGSIAIALDTLRKSGVRGLFRGQTGTLLREMAGGAAWFGIYEFSCDQFAQRSHRRRDELVAWELMTAGSFAGIGYNAALFPADVVKSIQQTEEEMAQHRAKRLAAVGGKDPVFARKAFMQVAKDLYAGEGVRGFYRGLGVTLCRSVPGSALIVATYELMSRHCTE